MSCSEFEIRDYFLGELAEPDRLRTARHVSACSDCAVELEELRHLRFALESVPDQEPPQRIGFVSDKIFEPSRARRLWNGFWNSGPRLGFASAAMLSVALTVFALRPAPALSVAQAPVPLSTAAPGRLSALEIQPLIDQAVRKAVLETEARQQQHTETLLAAAQRRHEQEQQALMLRVADSFTMLQKRVMVNRASLVSYGGDAQ